MDYGEEVEIFAATPTVGLELALADVSAVLLHPWLPAEDIIYVRPPPNEISRTGRPCDDRYGRQHLEQQLVGMVQQVERQVLDKVKHSIRL